MDYMVTTKILFYITTAVAVMFLVEAVYFAVSGPLSRQRSVNRRLSTMKTGKGGEEALRLLREERGIFVNDLSAIGWLRTLLIQSGLRITVSRIVLLLLAAFLAVFLAVQLIPGAALWHSAVAAVAIGILIPLQVIRFIRSRRQSRFTSQLPDALDVVVRSLRSGHPVPVALGMVGREMPDPVGTEFGLTIDEMTYGLDTTTALKNLSARVGVPDLALLITAVSLQTAAGGNLSEVLGNLSKVLRDRFQLRRKVRSLSAEGRVSAYGLTILPILVFFAIYLQNPNYYTDVWQEPMFLPVFVGVFLWSLVGDVIMFKMINFKY
jgi:tight adherence protein B